MSIRSHRARIATTGIFVAGLTFSVSLALSPGAANATGGGSQPPVVGVSCPNAPTTTLPQLNPTPGSPTLHPASTTCQDSTSHVAVFLNGDGRVRVPLNDGSVVTFNLHGQIVNFDPTAVELPLCASCGVGSIGDGTDTATLTYNSAEQVTQLVDVGPGTAPGGNVLLFSYDGDGNLLTINGDGVSVSMTYDAADRRVATVDDGGATYDFTYDARGDLISAGPNGSMTVLTYDADGRLTDYGPTANPSATTLSYDADGNLVGIAGTGGSGNYSYNSDGTLASVTDGGGTGTYAYDSQSGLLASIALPGGVTTTYQYDSTRGDVLTASTSGTASGPQTTTQYTYDHVGNLTEVSDGTTSTAYSYDGDGRVVQVVPSGGPIVSINWGDENNGTLFLGGATLNCGPSAPALVPPSCNAGLSGGNLQGGGLLNTGGNIVGGGGVLTLGGGISGGGGGDVGVGQSQGLGGPLFNSGGTGFGGGSRLGGGILSGSPGSSGVAGDGGSGFGGGIFDGGGFGTGTVQQGGQLTVGGVLTLGGSPYVWISIPWVGGVSCYECDPFGGGGILLADNGAATVYDHDGNVLSTGSGELPHTLGGPGSSIRVTFTYDSLGREVLVDFLEGDPDQPIVIGYDSSGRLDEVTDPLGNITRFAYDGQNRLVSETPPDGGTSSFSYDGSSGDLSQVTDPSGSTTKFVYDQNGTNWRLDSVTDPAGRVTTYDYDSSNRQTSTTDNLGNVTTYDYNSQGAIDSVVDPDGTRTATYDYDSAGNVTSIIDPLGNTVTYTYDALNRMTGLQDPLGHITTYDYMGNTSSPSSVTDPRANVVRYTYDADGALDSVTAPDGLAVTYTYDPGSPPPVLPDAPFTVLLGLLAMALLGGATLLIQRSRRGSAPPPAHQPVLADPRS